MDNRSEGRVLTGKVVVVVVVASVVVGISETNRRTEQTSPLFGKYVLVHVEGLYKQ